jgi:hypothetical protein
MFTRSSLALVVVLALAASAHAQKIIKIVPTQLKGKIVRVAPGGVVLHTGGNQNWTITVPNTAEVKVTGRAEPEALVPGTFVQFNADVDKRQSKVHEKLGRLVICTPSDKPEGRPGAVRNDNSAPSKRGQGDGAAKAGAAAKTPHKLPPAATRKPAGNPNVESFEIRAQVASYRAGKLTVFVQNPYFKPRLTVDLADDAVIEVESGDLTFVKPGDAASVVAISFEIGKGEALEMEVEMAAPLGGLAKKAKKPAAKQPAAPAGKEVAKGKEPPAGKEPVAPPKDGKKPDDSKPPEGDFEPQLDLGGPGQATAKPPEKPAATPGDKAKPSELPDEKVKQIVALLQFSPEELQGKAALTVKFDPAAEPELFMPCKAVPGKDIREKFGAPPAVGEMNGKLQVGEGEAKEVQWKLWVYGPVRFVLDENETTRYFSTGKK